MDIIVNKYAVIDNKTNVVWGVIKWDGAPLNMNKPPFIGRFLLQSDAARPGYVYDPNNNTFTNPIKSVVNVDIVGE